MEYAAAPGSLDSFAVDAGTDLSELSFNRRESFFASGSIEDALNGDPRAVASINGVLVAFDRRPASDESESR